MSAKRTKFSFQTSEIDGAVVLRLGDSHYHADSYEALEAKFREVEAIGDQRRIVVDFADVALFSSTALRALRAAYRRFEDAGGRIVAAGGGELVAGVLRFAPFVRHYSSVEQAVAAFEAETAEGQEGNSI